MKYSATLLAIAATTLAQTISDLPACSLECVASGVQGVGCGLTDFECSCGKADELTPAITPCVQEACPNSDDQNKVIETLAGICANAGVPITIPTPPEEPEESAPAPTVPSFTDIVLPPAPTETDVIPLPSFTDIVITDSSYPVPTGKPEESCEVITITETVTESTPIVHPPYPTGPESNQPPKPTGTGGYPVAPPEFTGAAVAVKVPAGIAGLLGLAAFLV